MKFQVKDRIITKKPNVKTCYEYLSEDFYNKTGTIINIKEDMEAPFTCFACKIDGRANVQNYYKEELELLKTEYKIYRRKNEI